MRTGSGCPGGSVGPDDHHPSDYTGPGHSGCCGTCGHHGHSIPGLPGTAFAPEEGDQCCRSGRSRLDQFSVGPAACLPASRVPHPACTAGSFFGGRWIQGWFSRCG